VYEKEVIYLNIPKGIDNNEFIVLSNKGNVINESLKGDIKMIINVENTTPFTRDGLNLIYHKMLTLKEALCGFSFELQYINNKLYTINSSSGNIIVPEYKKIIPNLGLQRENYKGNLIIIFNIEFPNSLTEQQILSLKDIL
jgi:DnaJ family protein A protein 2